MFFYINIFLEKVFSKEVCLKNIFISYIISSFYLIKENVNIIKNILFFSFLIVSDNQKKDIN